MDWLKKIASYAPDIVGAIATGGTSAIATTALRIAAKELTGNESASVEEVKKAAEEATPEQLLALKQCNNDFIVKRLEIQAGEMVSARDMHKSNHKQADDIADRIVKWNMAYIAGCLIIEAVALYFFHDNTAIITPLTSIVTLVVRDLLAQIQAVTGFYFGSSIGSKAKDK